MQHGKRLCSARVTDVSSVDDFPMLEPKRKAALLARLGTPCTVICTSYSLLQAGPKTLDETRQLLTSWGLLLGSSPNAAPDSPPPKPFPPQGPLANLPKGSIEVIDPQTKETFTVSTWNCWEMSVPVAGYYVYVRGPVEQFDHLKGKQVELFDPAQTQYE